MEKNFKIIHLKNKKIKYIKYIKNKLFVKTQIIKYPYKISNWTKYCKLDSLVRGKLLMDYFDRNPNKKLDKIELNDNYIEIDSEKLKKNINNINTITNNNLFKENKIKKAEIRNLNNKIISKRKNSSDDLVAELVRNPKLKSKLINQNELSIEEINFINIT